MRKIDDLSYEELKEEMLKISEPKFKASQIFDWIHKKCVDNFDEMTNISQDTKAKLNNPPINYCFRDSKTPNISSGF
jgi:23S rRNA (adenine2503-C2)-methyltransferase